MILVGLGIIFSILLVATAVSRRREQKRTAEIERAGAAGVLSDVNIEGHERSGRNIAAGGLEASLRSMRSR